MKKLLSILLIITCSAQAQVTLNAAAGINERKHFLLSLGIDYDYKIIHATTEITPSMNAFIEGTHFGGKAGITVLKIKDVEIIPEYGYYYRLFSTDKTEFTKGKNYWCPGYFLKLQAPIVYLEAAYINELQISIGAKIKIK